MTISYILECRNITATSTIPLYTNGKEGYIFAFSVWKCRNSHHVKHCEEEEEIVERLLNFLTENRDEGDEVATETDQGHGQEQDSLQQKGQHVMD